MKVVSLLVHVIDGQETITTHIHYESRGWILLHKGHPINRHGCPSLICMGQLVVDLLPKCHLVRDMDTRVSDEFKNSTLLCENPSMKRHVGQCSRGPKGTLDEGHLVNGHK